MTEMELFAALGQAVAYWHQRGCDRAGEVTTCSCGQPDVLCPYRGVMRRLGLATPVKSASESTR